MKKTLILLTLIISLTSKSQITLEHSQNVGIGQEGLIGFETSNLGYKYLGGGSIHSSVLDTVTVYNLDWSIHKQIILPIGYFYLSGVSDNLFNSDSLIEFLIGKDLTGGSGYDRTISVINELGQIQYTFPDTNIKKGGDNNIIKVGSEFKFKYLTNSYQYKIYSLPGTLPCNQCSSISGIREPNQGNISGFNIYPNPFNNTMEIEYQLSSRDNPRLILTDIEGRELKTISLVGQSDKVSLNTSDLSKGTIIVSLYNGQSVVSKKVVKID